MKEVKICINCDYSCFEHWPEFDDKIHLFCSLKDRITFGDNTCERWQPDQGGENFERPND